MNEVLAVCQGLKRRIDMEKERLQMLREMADAITIELDGLPRGDQYASSRVERIAAAIIDAENLIFQLVRIKAECTLELNEALGATGVEGAARQVLLYRYGLCMPFNEIARRLGYHVRRIFKIHSAAMKRAVGGQLQGSWDK